MHKKEKLKYAEENLQDLSMAKKRDHKIMVTEEAIEKVPLIKYKEIPDCDHVLLQEFAKEVLRISKDENNSNEVALTFSLDYRNLIAQGRDYMGITLGDEHSVDPCMNTTSYHLLTASLECVVIIVHNHPSLSKFSLGDIKFFLQNRTVKMMVVVTNLGSVSYLVKKDNYNQRSAIKIYNSAVNMHNEGNRLHDYQKAVSFFLSKCYDANIVYEDR